MVPNFGGSIRLQDPEDPGTVVGDIQDEGKMVVGPGSVVYPEYDAKKETGGYYEIVSDKPPAFVRENTLKDAFGSFINARKKRPEKTAQVRKNDAKPKTYDIKITEVGKIKEFIEEGRLNYRKGGKYGGYYFGPHPVHGSTTGQNFHVVPRLNCFHCYRNGHDSGGGPLWWIAIEEGLIDCSEAYSGLSYGKVRYNLESNGKLKDMGFANAEKEDGEWKYWKTEKDVAKTCVRLSQRVMTFDGLKKEFEKTLKGCVDEGYLTEEMFSEIWGAYKEKNISFPTFLQTTQRMNLPPESVFSLLDGDEGCETLSQLYSATKNELKRSQAKLVEGLLSLHEEEFDGGMGTLEDFIDLAGERFPSESPSRLEEAAERLAEGRDISFEVENLGGEAID
ncbi:hypothetical protein AKJ65_01525 [candidate division MSBL1 archaeon SCGC-AAA259E19]|uniref:Uncharacterized protein n=1 Tax=candidate division MSBL1 archaeon SCGC-AAA259E19 TaxID=1698264 RepID=A0A133UMT5_9EURY|nr:hypothetical protein AKJ65_01525 [candidate division MSBL1 archaeon SCGC-AAA259E19]